MPENYFADITVERMILHEVFQREDKEAITPPRLSKNLSTLDKEGLKTFQNRIIDAIGNQSHSVEMLLEKQDHDSVAHYIRTVINGQEPDFISASAAITEKLVWAQSSRKIPGGILLVTSGIIGNYARRFGMLIKAEVHSGFSRRLIENDNIVLEYLAELLLTPQQRLYKIGLFIEKGNELIPIVYDHLMTRLETRQAAKYFYESFLGCQPAPSDRLRTKDFFETTKSYVDGLPITNIEKLQYHDGLYSYLKLEQNNTISVPEFAERYLQSQHRDDYLYRMRDSTVGHTAIVKDLSYLKNKIKRRSIRFSSGVSLSHSNGNLNDVIEILDQTSEDTTVKIMGIVKDLD